MISPLPSLSQTDADSLQTEGEKFWNHIPVIGWIIGSIQWTKRSQVILREAEQKLLARQKPNPTIWGQDVLRIETAHFVCAVAQDTLGWPNNHFIPDDPVSTVFWALEDSVPVEAVFLQIEARFDIEIEKIDVPRWLDGTLGDIVDFVVVKRRSAPQPAGETWPPPPLRW